MSEHNKQSDVGTAGDRDAASHHSQTIDGSLYPTLQTWIGRRSAETKVLFCDVFIRRHCEPPGVTSEIQRPMFTRHQAFHRMGSENSNSSIVHLRIS